MPINSDKIPYSPAIEWDRERLRLLDQRRLPGELHYVDCTTAADVADSIRTMVVRGAPAIGIAAAYGVALAVRTRAGLPEAQRREALGVDIEHLAAARPTAVNLAWALKRIRPLVEEGAGFDAVAAAAEAIHEDDVAANRMLALLGSERLENGLRILTHCNTGPLATGGIGTAFGVIVAAWEAGKVSSVHFTETRPWMQGARLTAWELARAGVPATLMTESAAGGRALGGGVDWLIVGADRIAANADVVNKVGTAPLAALTRQGGGRVMAVAPYSTVDISLASGADVPIEERDGRELRTATGGAAVPEGISVANPAFDVTPAAHVDLLVTERGVIAPARGQVATILEGSGVVK